MDRPIRTRQKDIVGNAPPDGIILGEISFTHPYFRDRNFSQNGHFMRMFKNDYYGPKKSDLELRVFTKRFDNWITCELVTCEPKLGYIQCHLVEYSNLTWSEVETLFRAPFIWKFKTVTHGSVVVEVVTTLKHLPIHTASNLMKLFFNQDYSDYEKIDEEKFYADDFFQELKMFQMNVLKYGKTEVQDKKLLSKLRPYQCNAVQWMLHRESKNFNVQDYWEDWLNENEHEFTSVNGITLYYNIYEKVLTDKRNSYEFPKNFPSGILADEMGLGKTVVVIALILNHPRDINSELDNDNFLKAEKVITKKNDSPMKRKYEDLDSCSTDTKKQKCDENVKVNSSTYDSSSDEDSDDFSTYNIVGLPASQYKKPDKEFRCVCGALKTQTFEDCVKCPECSVYQHKDCVGYEEEFVYFCPSCWPKQKLIKSKGTLIVAPSSIYSQWKEEITKHVADDAWARGVFMFNGDSNSFVQPSVLSSYNVVITTYSCLPSELNRTEQNRRNLRPKRQYLRKCSPLVLIEWWRVVLDEAQLVEEGSPNFVQISEMAKLIPTINRWSVTGTPIQKSVNDLCFLFKWMGVKPIDEENFWENYLYKPYLKGNPVPLFSVLSEVFWRNSKEDIAGELQLPEQTTEYHILKFSAIEQSFYMREHSAVSDEFLTQLRFLKLDLNRKLDSLNRYEISKILKPFLGLRQACSHHLAVRNQEILDEIESIASSKNKKKKDKKDKINRTMTLDALLKYLQEKTKTECESALKCYFKALNGLGDVYSALEDWPNAVKNYKEVLLLTKEYNDKKIKVDILEKLHAMHNYSEVLEKSLVEEKSVSNEEFLNEAKNLEKEYLKKDVDEYETEKKELKKSTDNVSSAVKNLKDKSDAWWINLVDEIMSNGLFDKLVDSFRDKKNVAFLEKIMTQDDIKCVIREWWKSMKKNREVAAENLRKLCSADLDGLVNKGSTCHLKKSEKPEKAKNKCGLCAYESRLLDYEDCFFARDNNSSAEGSSKPCNEENLLKSILKICKSNGFGLENCLQNGESFFELLDAFKEELKQFRAVWGKLNNLVQDKYELSTSKLAGMIEREKIEKERKKFQAECDVKSSETKKKYGTLLYLKNLDKDNPTPDPCPICFTEMMYEWCVLQCGHSYCLICIKDLLKNAQELVKNAKEYFITCPVCREKTKGCDIGFVSLNNENSSKANVGGRNSTKIQAVIKTIFDLRKSDPKVKILIFSTWDIVLKVLKKALDERRIKFRSLSMAQKNLEADLSDFKNPDLNVTVLLLPISLGCKGLNLTEATHVFLIEPVLNPADELQAIGRVHRMGQTKKTVVHRFLVSGTIEEKIHSAVSEAKDKWARENATLADLKNLFAIDSS